ncbi:hypothetical protein LSH36_1037g00042 [Paralvinella palmiformis]|uniref:Uncharacterized protein n=1 Tax=Paralvinella palmiformis TaxID=53620 RepID=A0AAD9MS41_9ANNE|nr:hypothetical protein LSH36_1037g00042 [Paralvinella palmiformis]
MEADEQAPTGDRPEPQVAAPDVAEPMDQ